MLFESGALKPEAFGNEPALKVIATKLGLNFDKMVYMTEEPNLSPEKLRVLGLFDLIAAAVQHLKEPLTAV